MTGSYRPASTILLTHMDASDKGEQRSTLPDSADDLEIGRVADAETLASDRDPTGVPVHRGWAPLGGRHRWMEPFVLALLAAGPVHGYAVGGQLAEMGVTGGTVNIGDVYRTLRDLELAGLLSSSWSAEPVGPQRRDYELTTAGYAKLDEWAAVMKERARLIAEFDGLYLESVSRPRP